MDHQVLSTPVVPLLSPNRRVLRRHSTEPLSLLVLALCLALAAADATAEAWIGEDQIRLVVDGLDAATAEDDKDRFERGVRQVATLWRESDGSAEGFRDFCLNEFITDAARRHQTVARLEAAFESIDGHLGEMGRDLYWHLSVDTGPILAIDHALARYSPTAHLAEDLFQTQIAFIVLLNYPQYSLGERLELGPGWSREEWAQARLAGRFMARVPPEVSQARREFGIAAGNYIREYNIWMHHLVDEDGHRPFPAGMKLISHWNLRDELKSQYAEPAGLARQEMIYEVMLRIIRQQIPQAVINNPAVDWKLAGNVVTLSSAVDGPSPAEWTQQGEAGTPVDSTPEPDTRYARLLDVFHGQQMLDPYYPAMPTLIERRFQHDREMPESEVTALFRSLLTPEIMAQVGAMIERRLGRDLRPFDIWYDGFKSRSAIGEDQLNELTRSRYPDAQAFEAGMPDLLVQLGFDEPTARFLSSRIAVDPSRGAGHASGPGRPVDKARLRTRVGAEGMDYKGYNIAVHEFGHNVEQVFSTCRIDRPLLRGVPNTAFTEAFAFVFQSRDLDLLGIEERSAERAELNLLDSYWWLCEITAVSLMDIRVWHWMYAHPEATPAELKTAVSDIAQNLWNEIYAPVIGIRDVEILAIYSHMITGSMYLPDYTIGGIIRFQIEEYLKTRSLGDEMERMCTIGSVTPAEWMRQAVGAPISTEPLLQAVRAVLARQAGD